MATSRVTAAGPWDQGWGQLAENLPSELLGDSGMNSSQSTAASGWTAACIVATTGRDQRPDLVAPTSVWEQWRGGVEPRRLQDAAQQKQSE